MSDRSKFCEGATFCLITGASRGIGQAVAVEFAKLMGKDSALLLMARTTSGLEETKLQVTEAALGVKVVTQSVDLSNADNQMCLDSINDCLKILGKKASDFDHAIIVHNAASAGNLIPVAKMESISDLQNYYTFNLFSVICLNSQFLKVFNQEAVGKRNVIQVSSNAAVTAVPSVGMYCAGKVARDMMFKVLAVEEPHINVLNYAPGVVDTKILDEFSSSDERFRKFDRESARNNKHFLTPTSSAQKLVQILEEGKYTSGDHVDYYDDPNAYLSFME